MGRDGLSRVAILEQYLAVRKGVSRESEEMKCTSSVETSGVLVDLCRDSSTDISDRCAGRLDTINISKTPDVNAKLRVEERLQ